jgi:hypothetical protein
MILHAVTFTFRDDVTTEQLDALDAALAALPGQVDALRRYHHGRDLGLRPGTGDYAVAAYVDDEAGLTAYLDHPAHVAAVQAHVQPIVVSRQAVQLLVEDPEPRP